MWKDETFIQKVLKFLKKDNESVKLCSSKNKINKMKNKFKKTL